MDIPQHARPDSDIVAEQPASARSGKTWTQLRDGEQIISRAVGSIRLCGDTVTLGSSRPGAAGISVMTADIFVENALT